MSNENTPNLELNEYEISLQLRELLQKDLDGEAVIKTFEQINPADTESNGVVLKIGNREFNITITRVK